MWNNLKFGIPLLELFSLVLFLMGYFQVKTTFDDVNLNESSNDKPMKIILLLVDALRIDLFANNNFTFYQEMKKNKEDYQILYYGISSTPTATQLNLQAITTGNFPAFIDFSSNMAAQELKEDNIIYSMKRKNKSCALLGDETWFHMFPAQFDYKYISESFDVRDLDSDDNIVINHIESLIDQKYDFIVGHLLGIDHSGHSHNDSNFALWNKQQQYSDLLFKLYNQMDKDTMLLVVGDHGMSQDGNHGGESTKEISSAIYAINKQYKFNKTIFDQIINNRQYTQELLVDRNVYVRQAYSINLASTIAYLMGISIPYSNIGAIFSEMIPSESQENSCKENFIQVLQYLAKLETFESSLSIDFKNYSYNTSLNCQHIQQMINEIQFEIKQNSKAYDYFYLIISLSLMITLFAQHFIKISESLFNKQFTHKNNYIVYRLEKYIFVLTITFGSMVIFSITMGIKILSVYLLVVMLKQLILPLFSLSNISQITHKIIYPLPSYRRYFFIMVNLIVQKGIQELSANRQIIYTSNILGIILNVIIMLVISQFKLLWKSTLFIIVSISLMMLSEQYNLSLETTKPQSPLIFHTLSGITESFWVKFFIPAILLQKIMFKINKSVLFCMFLAIAQFIQIFNNSQTLHDIINEIFEGNIRFVTRFLPLFIYTSSIILILLNRNLSYFFLIVLTISGKQGMIAYCCMFYSVKYFLKFYNKILTYWIPPIAGGTISLILNYFWFTLGHRMSFSSVKFKDALIGSDSYSVVFNTALLIISIFGVFCTVDIIKKIINYVITSKQTQNQKIMQNEFVDKIMESLIAVQFSQIIFTCLHNSLNLYHQNIVDLFAQKVIYESIIFTILVLYNLLNESIQLINLQDKIPFEQSSQPYSIISNEQIEKPK